MSFSVTLLQLVNRTRRKRRMGDTTALSAADDMAAVDAVNQAIDLVLNTREWQFDLRHSQIVTKARIPSVSVTTTAGSPNVSISVSGLDSTDINGDFVLRVRPAGVTGYGDTALRGLTTSPVLSSQAVVSTPVALGATGSTTSGEMFYAEYFLADTVKSVHRVRYQENTIALDQLDPQIEFDEIYPRPHVEYGEPRVASVGGFDYSTYLASESQPAPRLRMIVWPIPDDEYVLDYQYTYRHPELSATTDTLVGVPPEVVDMIVEFATADMMGFFDRRVEDARSLRGDTYALLDEIHERHGGQTADRAVVRNWDSAGGNPADRYSIHRGRLIGG